MIAIGPTASVLRLNTRLFLNCLDGVAEAKAAERPNDRTNSLSFIACHLVDARHFMTAMLHVETENPFANVLGNVQGIEDVAELPPLGRIRDAWRAVSPALEACVAELTDEELRVPSKQRFPVDDPTLFGALAFLVQHESYHIGQMALLRKFAGYPAMSYG